jgi:hypothetical protein
MEESEHEASSDSSPYDSRSPNAAARDTTTTAIPQPKVLGLMDPDTLAKQFLAQLTARRSQETATADEHAE